MAKRKGLGKGLGKGYKNLVIKDPYVHSMSAKGVKTYQKSAKPINLNAIKETRHFTLDDDYSIVVQWDKTSYGFRHLAKLMYKGREVASNKATYYNRTWESYEYQTVMHGLLQSYFEPKEAEKMIQKLERNRSSMWAKGTRYRSLPEETREKLQDLYGQEVPNYLDVVNKNLIKIRISDWQGDRWVEITPKDVIEYYDTQARNIKSGARTLAGETGDWRNIDALAKESLEIFKITNRQELVKLGKKRGMTLKAKGRRDYMRSVLKFEDLNPDYPNTQMEGIAKEINHKYQHAPYIDEKIENTKNFYTGALDNFGNRIKDREIQKEFKKKLKAGKLDARGVKKNINEWQLKLIEQALFEYRKNHEFDKRVNEKKVTQVISKIQKELIEL